MLVIEEDYSLYGERLGISTERPSVEPVDVEIGNIEVVAAKYPSAGADIAHISADCLKELLKPAFDSGNNSPLEDSNRKKQVQGGLGCD
jgi:hypothetical protein